MGNRALWLCAVITFSVSTSAVAIRALGAGYTDVHVGEIEYELDFPAGRCGGHAPTAVRWTSPKATSVDVVGGVWKMRNSAPSDVSLWVRGHKLIDRVPVPARSDACNSDKPYTFSRILADNDGNPGGLKKIALAKGDEILIGIGGNDFTGLDLTIRSNEETWELARDFGYETNPKGPWAYGMVAPDATGQPGMTLFETVEADFNPDGRAQFGKGQPAWVGRNLAPHISMIQSKGLSPFKQRIRYVSDKTVYTEALLDNRWVGRSWAADGTIKLAYEGSSEDAFQIEIDKEVLATGWELLSRTEAPRTATGARHFVVELSNMVRPVTVKVHTLLDGTAVLTRWLEITNNAAKPVALTGIYPWTSLLVANEAYWGRLSPPKRFDHAFTLGYFTDSDHCWEGWFQWQPLTTPGATEIGCDKGECFDDPFFIIRNEGTGHYLIGHLEWPANWQMRLDYEQGSSHLLRFKIGPWASDAHRVIAPGETIKTPAVHLGLVAGDLDATVQAMHDHVRRSVLPSLKRQRAFRIQYALPGDQGYLSRRFGDPSGYTEESVLRNIDVASAVGAELFIMDAGWWDVQGDWEPSVRRFPRGLKPIVEYAHKKNLLFGLYGEIEKAGGASRIARANPAWIEWYQPFPVLNLAIPEAAAHMETELIGIIERYQLDLFRLDFNIPSAKTKEGLSNNRNGIKENNFWRYYDAFYGIFERIHAKYPDLILQQAACGGGRNDLGVVRRFHEQYLSDGLRLPYQVQNYCGQTLALPPENFIIAHGADAGGGTGNAENLDTNLRVAFTLSTPWLFAGTVAPSVEELSPDRRERYLHYGAIYKEFIRPLLPTCKVYHHAPVSARGGVTSSGWFAMEFAAPDRTKGWATIIRIGPSESDTYLFKPRGLDRGKIYRLTFDSTGETVKVDGLRLVQEGLPIRLEGIMTSELLLFESQPDNG